MTDSQILTVVLAAVPPTLAVLIGILMNNARLSDLRHDLNGRFDIIGDEMNRRFNDVDRRFSDADRRTSELREEMNRRFDEAKDIWRAELHRVEEVLDARLKHVEQR